MGSRGRFLKALFGILTLVGFVYLLLVGMLETGESQTKTMNLSGSAASFKHMKLVFGDGEKVGTNSDLINYMSKRRVPNGPDPIHNRRAGNSGRPPGQA